ncbi:hypothetical protein GF407_16835 [candidate division KSB1 bacterium]|nr:hypothetical protein [candidate division KSB1 bacterium]
MCSRDIIMAKERKALMTLMDEGDYRVPKRQVDENLLLATWNIQNLSNRKTMRTLQYIADICERFDIIALQEIKSDLRGLAKLQKLLPGNYNILVSDTTGNYERFAFLYDKRTVISTGFVSEIGFPVPGETHQGYQLHRMPYCASFRAGRFDFVIVNVHIYYGSSSVWKAQREKEIRELVEHIYWLSKKEQSRVFDRDFFVVGDFNIEQAGDRFFNTLVSKGFQMPAALDTLHTNFLGDKTYDKIAWVDRPSFYFSGRCNVIPFGHVVYQDGDSLTAKKKISDHLPLWAEFRINELTQELDQIISNPQG